MSVGGVWQADERVVAAVHDGELVGPRRNRPRRVVTAAHDALGETAAERVSQLIVGLARSTLGQLQPFTAPNHAAD